MTTLYRNYVLGLLTLVYTLNFLDRSLIALLLEPIKQDLHLSDTQLGFTTGIAFALFYATLGLPMARWADRGNRATLTAWAIGLWGVTVMACLMVRNFTQLVMARIAAAIGEAGCMPPTYSLIGDYFPKPADRTRAMSIYWLASPVASLVSFVGGGWLSERVGWRMTFFLMGLPALFVALVVRLTVREPRSAAECKQPIRHSVPSTREVLRILWHRHSTRHLGVAIILLYTLGLGMAPWYAAFMMRTHGLGTADLGLWMGWIFCLGGLVGILAGGQIAARWLANHERSQLRWCAVLIALLMPAYLSFLLMPQPRQALTALFLLVVVFSSIFAPIFALMQRLVADEMRATTVALVMLFANLIGMGAGPQVVGILSDALRSHFANDSLRWAMSIISLLALWSAYHFWRAGESVDEDLADVAHAARAA
jgi:predicted MFS family arabinose efflux permease